jgi:hypothetical protein
MIPTNGQSPPPHPPGTSSSTTSGIGYPNSAGDTNSHHLYQHHHYQHPHAHGVQQPPSIPGRYGGTTATTAAAAAAAAADHMYGNGTGGKRLTWRWVPTLEPMNGLPSGPGTTAATNAATANIAAINDLYSSPIIPHRGASSLLGTPTPGEAMGGFGHPPPSIPRPYFPPQHHFHMQPYFHYGGGVGIGVANHSASNQLPSPPESPYQRVFQQQQQHQLQLMQNQHSHAKFASSAPGPGASMPHHGMNPHLLGPSYPPYFSGTTTGFDPTAASAAGSTEPGVVDRAASASPCPATPASTKARTETPSAATSSKKRQASSSKKTSPKIKKPKMGPRRSTEDLDAANLLASMMKSEQNTSSDSDDGTGTEEGNEENKNTPAGKRSPVKNSDVQNTPGGTPYCDPTGDPAAANDMATQVHYNQRDNGSITPTLATDVKWFHGAVSLHLPEDDDVLSPLHCFMRRYCVEAFSATPEDVATPRYGKSHGFKVEVGQVGLRYVFTVFSFLGVPPPFIEWSFE